MIQLANIFQARVHALSVEGDHGVRGVAQNYNSGAVMVWFAFYGDDREVGVGFVLDDCFFFGN